MFSVSPTNQLSIDPDRANYCLAYFELLPDFKTKRTR